MDTALTLVSFFERYFARLFLDDARPRTFAAYDETLKHWKCITGDPELPFDAAVLAAFKVELHSTLSAATVNKHLRQVNAILAKVGPAGPGNRDALGMITCTVWTRPLREDRPRPRAIADDVVDAIYAACEFARRPRLSWCSPAAWWRALICLAITSGFRRGALLALRWSDVDVAGRTVRVPASIDKCHAERVKPLHVIAVKHLLRIRGRGELVFAFHGSEIAWYRTWHAIQDRADISSAEQIRFHDLKRFAGTRYAATSSPWVVQQMLDHSSIETSRFYVNAAEQCRAAVDAFPLPECFKQGG
jgi:integrase